VCHFQADMSENELTISGRAYCGIDAADMQGYGLYSKLSLSWIIKADVQHAKGITHRDLKPEVRSRIIPTITKLTSRTFS